MVILFVLNSQYFNVQSNSIRVIFFFCFLVIVAFKKFQEKFIKKNTICFFPQIVQAYLTSLKASLNSFTPIISAVSARSLGPINSTKSSKSTWPPTIRQKTQRRLLVNFHKVLKVHMTSHYKTEDTTQAASQLPQSPQSPHDLPL